MSGKGRRSLHHLLVASVITFLFVLLCPGVALARDYSIGPVNIDATVDKNGTLTVRETRRFDFDGEYRGVYWKLVKGTYGGRTIEPVIVDIGEIKDGLFVPFEQSDSEANGTYSVTDHSSYDELKIFSAHSSEDAEFVINYRYPNLVSRWDDVGELYWKFVSDGWDQPSNNVTCTVHLPVPSGASVLPGKNVRAWGHGPLDANVTFDDGDVVFTVPSVGKREFAEARVTFPEEWVPGADRASGKKLDSILAEEEQWTNEANGKRARARMMVIGSSAALGVLGVGSLVFALVSWIGYKRAHKPIFDDEYYRDVPSEDHPALLGALYHGGTPGKDEFTASLMRLADMGKIQLDLVTYQKRGTFGQMKEKSDYRLLELERAEGGLRGDAMAATRNRIDRSAMKFLFRTVADHHSVDEKLMGPNGERYVLASSFGEVARKHPEAYENGYNDWCSSIKSSMETRGFTREEGSRSKGLSVALGTLGIFAGVGGVFLAIALHLPVWLAVLLAVLNIGAAVMHIIITTSMVPRSREAIELTAKLKALKHWLCDFTRLDEAVPTDVVLWNKLLVMATALGVADEVIEQLKVATPKLLEDPGFYSYGWYYYGSRGLGMPANVMGASFGQAHSVSSAKLASSSDSSSGGGGGGFSGGGGGGFGGGGGGGAF